MKIHELKTWPMHFDAIMQGNKRFEFRYNDRDFQVHDVLHLKEWQPALDWKLTRNGGYTGRWIMANVTYMLTATDPDGTIQPEFVPEGWCIMSLDIIGRSNGR